MASKETDVARLTRFSARFLPALKEPWQVNGAGPTAGLGVARAPSNGGYIAGPWYDNIFFIFSPLIALALGMGLSFTVLSDAQVTFMGRENNLMAWFVGPFIMAHLVAVVYRSHL
ncbi:MAG TPA: hypothetical protein EYM34_06745, partial [Alphaproteobacteria bacterium]|nr:hypothetical protein [Alphaproteobacteria bacterium]